MLLRHAASRVITAQRTMCAGQEFSPDLYMRPHAALEDTVGVQGGTCEGLDEADGVVDSARPVCVQGPIGAEGTHDGAAGRQEGRTRCTTYSKNDGRTMICGELLSTTRCPVLL